MNMLDDDSDSFHATRDSYSYLSDIEWSAVERMSSTIGEHAVSAMLSALDRDGQHAAVAKFIQHELDASQERVTLLHQQGSQQAELLREQGAQQFELLRQQQAHAAVPGATHARRPETLKIDISKYRGVEEDSLLRWFVELDDAIRARHIVDEQMQVAFAQSNLAGRECQFTLPSPRLKPRCNLLKQYIATTDCRKTLFRTVIPDSHRHFGRRSSSFSVRNCRCRHQLTRKQMDRPSV